MFLVARCLATLTHLVFNYRVEFSSVGNWLKDCPSSSLIGMCSNQQEVLALPGKDLGAHSCFSVRFGPAPGVSRLGSVNHGRSDSGNSCDEEADFVCNSLTQPPLKSDAHQEGFRGSPSLSGPHGKGSCKTPIFCDGILFFHRPSYASKGTWEKQFVGDFNLKFAALLILEAENALPCVIIEVVV